MEDTAEVIRRAMGDISVKELSSELHVSTSLVYKWCESRQARGESGARNPLDRLQKLYELTGDDGPTRWMCEMAGGFFTKNPNEVSPERIDVLNATRIILEEFTDVLRTISDSNSDDNAISPDEAAKIRKEWEELKSVTETFVNACEQGVYAYSSDLETPEKTKK